MEPEQTAAEPAEAPKAEPSASAAGRYSGYALLGLAAAVAVAVAAWLILGGGDSSPAGVALSQTPWTVPPGGPTPVPGTGVIDEQRPEFGSLAPDFALVDARDPTVVRRLSDFRGTPVVLNWYASWCAPCRDEIPEFHEAQGKLGDAVVFLGVNPMESRERALRDFERVGATYPAVLDSTGAVSEHYRIRYMPTTYFIDADGYLRAVRTGRVTLSALQEGLREIGVTYEP
jgi:cytochrome c biogenesis protein CcmG/thiol:disulfide interchange protein DsbE